MSEIKPAYLIKGTDEGKIDAARARLRARAEREGGPGALEVLEAPEGQQAPDPGALLAVIPAMSLVASHRYVLADGVERWSAKQAAPVIEALGRLPPDLTVVLVARERPPKVAAPGGLAGAVEAAGGQVLEYRAPRARELPRHLVAEAERRGFRLTPGAARLMVERMGEGTVRLANELDRLALWAEQGGEVTEDDLDAMVADTSEEMVWTLSDAILARDGAEATRAAERLSSQGEALARLVYGVAKRLRDAGRALAALEAGGSQREVESELRVGSYAAKMLLRRLRGASRDELRGSLCAIADLEWWTRGGADYPDDVALALAVRRATGAGARGS